MERIRSVNIVINNIAPKVNKSIHIEAEHLASNDNYVLTCYACYVKQNLSNELFLNNFQSALLHLLEDIN